MCTVLGADGLPGDGIMGFCLRVKRIAGKVENDERQSRGRQRGSGPSGRVAPKVRKLQLADGGTSDESLGERKVRDTAILCSPFPGGG